MLALRSLAPGRALDRRDLGRLPFDSTVHGIEARLAVAHLLVFAHARLARLAFAVTASGFRARHLGGVVGVAQPLYTGSALAADAGVAFEDALGELPQHLSPISIFYLEAL